MFPYGITAPQRDTEKHFVVARWLKAFNAPRGALRCRIENGPVREARERAAAPLRAEGLARRLSPQDSPSPVRQGLQEGPWGEGDGREGCKPTRELQPAGEQLGVVPHVRDVLIGNKPPYIKLILCPQPQLSG